MKPIIKFQIDPNKDYDILQGFIRDAKFDNGRSLTWAVSKKHPVLANIVTKNFTLKLQSQIKKYIIRYFDKYANQIERNMAEYQKEWENKHDLFFRLVNNIFQKFPWPKGKYIAYATIWGLFPRSLEDKTFCVPAIYKNTAYVNVIIAHEMLHFIFYAYLFEKYPELNDKEQNFLTWNISEIFNSLVQNSISWINVFQLKTKTYPEHQKIEDRLRKKYPEITSQNIDRIIKEIILASKALILKKQMLNGALKKERTP